MSEHEYEKNYEMCAEEIEDPSVDTSGVKDRERICREFHHNQICEDCHSKWMALNYGPASGVGLASKPGSRAGNDWMKEKKKPKFKADYVSIEVTDALRISIRNKDNVCKRLYPNDLAHIWVGESGNPAPQRKTDYMIRVTKKGNVIVEDLTLQSPYDQPTDLPLGASETGNPQDQPTQVERSQPEQVEESGLTEKDASTRWDDLDSTQTFNEEQIKILKGLKEKEVSEPISVLNDD